MVSNKLNVSIKPTRLAVCLTGCLALASALLLPSCSDHEARMNKLHADHEAKYEQELAAQRDSLQWADSVQLQIVPIINKMIEEGHFEYVKGEYDELGRYIVRGTDAENNLGRNYLHASVNEYGVTQLVSEYRGSRHINHTQIVAEGADGTRFASRVVPLQNDGANYRFTNEGVCHESVTFVADSLLAYIHTHADDNRMKCVQLGANSASNTIQLTSQEIRQLSDCYLLGRALAIQLRSSQTSKVAAEKISVLETKIELQRQMRKKKEK